MKCSVALFCIIFIARSSAYSIFQDEWETWKDLHGKQYSYEEEIKRKYIWQTNLKYVIRHNQEAENGAHTFTLGMNKFADMDADEFAYMYLGTQTRTGMGYCKKMFVPSGETHAANKTVDWRTEGYVTPVKNQLACGSCWAFSTTGSVEGQHFKKTGKLVSLSEQNLMDCSRPEGDMSCQGGLMDNAFEYIIKNGGIDTEKSYPYNANNSNTCKYNPQNSGATISGCVDVESGNEKELRQAVAKIGPISVAIDASKPSFHLYREGTYYEPSCSSTQLDHGVLAVGYGHEKTGGAYWLVKNSWGEQWGEKGYIRMARNRDNNCGIATQASYPVV